MSHELKAELEVLFLYADKNDIEILEKDCADQWHALDAGFYAPLGGGTYNVQQTVFTSNGESYRQDSILEVPEGFVICEDNVKLEETEKKSFFNLDGTLVVILAVATVLMMGVAIEETRNIILDGVDVVEGLIKGLAL